MRTVVVVGGGISGIVSSLLLRDKFEKVVLVEKSHSLGGLLRSTQFEDFSFDQGAHFLRDTGDVALDEILFQAVKSSKEWLTLDRLKAGSYLNGVLNQKSQFVNANSLETSLYRKGVLELLSATTALPPEAGSLFEQLRALHGDTFTRHLFAPITRKFFGVGPEDLVPNANTLLFPNRVLAFNSEVSKKLKELDLYDQKLGYHSYNDGLSQLSNYYPASGGIGQWVDLLEQELARQGIFVATGSTVSEIRKNGDQVASIRLQNEEEIDCDRLVWTLSPHLFLAANSVKIEGLLKPQRLTSALYHFVIKGHYASDLYYLTCHDPAFKTFRTTLYGNIQSKGSIVPSKTTASRKGTVSLTVEAISKLSEEIGDHHESIFNEQVEMGLLHSDCEMISYQCSHVNEGFPLPTPQFDLDSKRILNAAKKSSVKRQFLRKSIWQSVVYE